MPPLVACALMHYQFETLHPFLDGNGRLGRLLIILFLVEKGHLPVALLYLSSYFERHKQRYYDGLQGVRERGAIGDWLQYFLHAVEVQANDAVRRSERLVDLGEKYCQHLAGSRGCAHELIDVLLAQPDHHNAERDQPTRHLQHWCNQHAPASGNQRNSEADTTGTGTIVPMGRV